MCILFGRVFESPIAGSFHIKFFVGEIDGANCTHQGMTRIWIRLGDRVRQNSFFEDIRSRKSIPFCECDRSLVNFLKMHHHQRGLRRQMSVLVLAVTLENAGSCTWRGDIGPIIASSPWERGRIAETRGERIFSSR